ncbi:4'-phosphopantetheinyl transferase family protein [Streptomyces sp. NPDC015346]|uniref:4'-phosphopantetheinyl transferase family protein n=1 Tax=Streptomyces sp. NPDC015346 TaxID=3364954 RepID=UPI0036FF99C3
MKDVTPAAGSPVVLATTEEVLAHPEADEGLLNQAERERAGRFRHDRDRRDFVAAHLLVRLCAARLLRVGPADVAFAQHCPGCDRPGHGRPLLVDRPDVHLSLSHSAGVVAAAAGLAPIGVDVERLDKASDALTEERVLAPAELELVRSHADPKAAFLRLWVRKEALIKVGRAELDTLGRLDLSALPLGPPGPAPAVHRFEDFQLLDFTDPGRRALLAVASGAPALLGSAATPPTGLPRTEPVPS